MPTKVKIVLLFFLFTSSAFAQPMDYTYPNLWDFDGSTISPIEDAALSLSSDLTIGTGATLFIDSYSFPTGPPADDQILKYDLATTTLGWEADAGGAGTSQWTDTGSVLHPNEETVDNVAIGGTDSTAPIYLEVTGEAQFASDLTVGGSTFFSGLGYNWPDTKGSTDQVLALDSNGNFKFSTAGAGSGDVVGPAGATDHAVARFDTATGKLLQDTSGVTIDDSDNITIGGSASIADDLTVGSTLYAMSGQDRVGIGTTAPSDTLQVAGNTVIGDGSDTDFTLTFDANTSDGKFTWDEDNVNLISDGDFIVQEEGDARTHATGDTDPHIIAFSADAGVAADYVEMYHDQTTAIIQSGSGDIVFKPDITVSDDTPHWMLWDSDTTEGYEWHLETGAGGAPWNNFTLWRMDGTLASPVVNPNTPLFRFDNSNDAHFDTGDVTIGKGNLYRDGGADEAQLTIKSAPTQTANILLIEDDNGVDRIKIPANYTQQWFLSSAVGGDIVGAIHYSTPTGVPGISMYTGAAGDENRFDIVNTGGAFYVGFNADGTDYGLQLNTDGTSYIDKSAGNNFSIFENPTSGENPGFYQRGYITNGAAKQWIGWKVSDATDNFELARQSANIGAFDIQMPLITDNVTVNGTVNFAADAQGDDDYEIDIPSLTALTTGLTVTFTANTANTDGATLEITSIGDLDTILKKNDTALATNDIEAGQVVTCVFDGTNWQMTSQIAN